VGKLINRFPWDVVVMRDLIVIDMSSRVNQNYMHMMQLAEKFVVESDPEASKINLRSMNSQRRLIFLWKTSTEIQEGLIKAGESSST